MSQPFELYLPRKSWLHGLDPRTKLWIVTLALAAGLVFRQIGLLAGLLIAAHLALLSAHIPARRLVWFWRGLAPLLVLILILQPLFAPGPGPDLVRLAFVRLTVNGILGGVSFALRAAALAFWAAVLLLTTHPTQLVQGLVKLGLPYTWGLTLGLALRYIPTTYSLFVTVSEAQQARGWVVGQGSLMKRARSYLPILVATIIGTLRLSDSLGLALGARGLGYARHRTTLYDLRLTGGDWLAGALGAAVFAALLFLRFGLGLGASPW